MMTRGRDSVVASTLESRQLHSERVFLLSPSVKSDLRSFMEFCDLAVQVSGKRDVFVEVSNVGCIRSAAFRKNTWN